MQNGECGGQRRGGGVGRGRQAEGGLITWLGGGGGRTSAVVPHDHQHHLATAGPVCIYSGC